jgi:hypothetical protein
VIVNGKTIFSKQHGKRFPYHDEIIALIKK